MSQELRRAQVGLEPTTQGYHPTTTPTTFSGYLYQLPMPVPTGASRRVGDAGI